MLHLPAGSRVNSASKTFEDDLKISPSSNCMSVSAEFSKSAGGKSKTVMMRFGDVIIRVIMSALKCSKTCTKRRRGRNTLLFLFNKLIQVEFGHPNSATLARVICKHFTISGKQCI